MVVSTGKTHSLITDLPINISMPSFNFPALIKKLKKDSFIEKAELKSAILLKSPERQIILAALNKGTEMSSFQSNKSITFKIMEGSLKFQSRKASVILDNGQTLVLDEHIKYRLTSMEDTILLITIANCSFQIGEN